MNHYGAAWTTENPIEIEINSIRLGGKWKRRDGKWCGAGLFHHYKTLQSLIAPWKKWDRWSELLLTNFIANRLTVVTGPANSTKTHNAAFFALCKYMAHPESTSVMVSSTDSRSLEIRIWGEIKKLWSAARRAYEFTPGRLIESRQMIVTEIEDEEANDFRNGIIGIPCMIGQSFVGLGKFVGVKNRHILLIADECQFMSGAFYDSISNLNSNAGFGCIALGNPKDRTDTLGRLAEPAISIGGWEGYDPKGLTFSWPTRFRAGKAICLDGRDSPNRGYPDEQVPFPHIIKPSTIADAVAVYGEDSLQVSMSQYGIFPRDAQARRVITRSLCDTFRAFEQPVWTHTGTTKLFGLDAAYGSVGGDRCVGVEMEFGPCSDGFTRLSFVGTPHIIPVSIKFVGLPEDQIVLWVMRYCTDRGIPPERVALDSTGRGSLVSAFGRLWSPLVHAVEFGGPPTDRYVSTKLQVRANKHYLNFMSELWYQFRNLIEADQLRRLPVNVMEEMSMRGWGLTAGNRIQVEPKDECKSRMGRSPDLGDASVVGFELARKIGFVLEGTKKKSAGAVPEWLRKMMDQKKEIGSKRQLNY